MNSILILSGSPGSGKTTVGKLLASRLPNGIHIESDIFYTFFGNPVAPHLPEADASNRAAIAAACQAAKSFHRHGYGVVLEGVFGPWMLPLMSKELESEAIDVRYVVLRTSLDAALARVRLRSTESLDDVIATMHPQFENLGVWEAHVLETTPLTPHDVVARLMEGLSGDGFGLSIGGPRAFASRSLQGPGGADRP